jgi:hypothetical protein
MPQIVSEVEEVAKFTAYLQFFQVQSYLFYIYKLNNVIYMLGVPSLQHKHHVVLYIFTFFYLKQNI